MIMEKELTNEELAMVSGGVLTDDADRWLQDNWTVITSNLKCSSSLDNINREIAKMRAANRPCTLEELKLRLSIYLDIVL